MSKLRYPYADGAASAFAEEKYEGTLLGVAVADDTVFACGARGDAPKQLSIYSFDAKALYLKKGRLLFIHVFLETTEYRLVGRSTIMGP